VIKIIVKRDGTLEDFTPAKINNWGEWAAEDLGEFIDWSSVVLDTVAVLPEKCSAVDLQKTLIKTCLNYDSWSYNRMAGRLYASFIYKEVFEDTLPTIQALHNKLYDLGFMTKLNYTDEEYEELEKVILHSRDLKSSHYELHQCRQKYAIKNRVSGKEYESQQFTYMRMAMALGESQPENRKMQDVYNLYELFSLKIVNAPTPNFVNLGTPLRGYASCCLYTTGDTGKSIAIGDHIAYTMTMMSAGIGSHTQARSLGNPVRGGAIIHQGKLPYYRALVGAIKANQQNGRGGACTTYYNIFDPEVEVISQLKNPMSTEDKKIRGMDYSAGTNKLFARKAAKKEKIFTFNFFTAPDLYTAMYGKDQDLFEELYSKYENDPNFEKSYISARDLILIILNEGSETGRAYLHQIDEINRHTPFKDVIYSSNLCAEITEPTLEYQSMEDLYSREDHGRGEIALCNLGGLVVSNITSEAVYEKAAYYVLLMIDKCIHLTDYALPHLGVTAKARMNAGVGIVGLAHLMAREGFRYSSPEGKNFIHTVAERHSWHLINASLKLGKELGNAPWMHKTKWPEGWLPISTYNKNVDSVVSVENKYDWEWLRSEIIANKGIRNSAVVAHMPTEASSKSAGMPNSVYPVRDLTLIKTDNNILSYWAAPDGEKLANRYERAWDIKTKDMIDVYAIVQKWTDQSISADFYRKLIGDEVITSSEMLKDYFYLIKMGLKTRYYVNSLTSEGTELNAEGAVCTSGGCEL